MKNYGASNTCYNTPIDIRYDPHILHILGMEFKRLDYRNNFKDESKSKLQKRKNWSKRTIDLILHILIYIIRPFWYGRKDFIKNRTLNIT